MASEVAWLQEGTWNDEVYEVDIADTWAWRGEDNEERARDGLITHESPMGCHFSNKGVQDRRFLFKLGVNRVDGFCRVWGVYSRGLVLGTGPCEVLAVCIVCFCYVEFLKRY